MSLLRLYSLSLAFFVAFGASGRAEVVASFPENSPAHEAGGAITVAGDFVDNVLVRRVGDLRSVPAQLGPVENLGGFNIVIVAGPGLAANTAALAAFERAAAAWEARISDSITVTINADLDSLGSNILGSTSSVALQAGYTTIRNQIVADAADETDDGIGASLPTAAQFLATLPSGFSLDGNLVASKANLKALGFTGLDTQFGVSDGEITFSTDFTFDYDNSDGVTPGQTDFETVAAHEIGHLLGFFSDVDTINAIPATAIGFTTLDLFRFRNGTDDPATAAEFTTFARNFVPGVDAILDEVSANPDFPERRMSTGLTNVSFPGTDGRQASHWKADELTGVYIGLMDPTLATDVFFPPESSDFRALDLIGYEIASSNPPAIVLGVNPVSFTEDGAAILMAGDATVTDTDSTDFEGGSLRLSGVFATGDQLGIRNEGIGAGQIGASAGTVTFGGVTIGTFSGGIDAALQVNFTSAAATPAAVQALVRNLTYQNVSQNPSTTQRSFTFGISDGEGGFVSGPAVLIDVNAVNDPPTSVAPLTVSGVEDMGLTFTGGNALSVADIDTTNLSVTLTATHGVLTIGTQTGLTFTDGDGIANVTMTFSGAQGDLNTALASLAYNSTADYHGSASIVFTTTDNDATPVVKTIGLTLTPVDDIVSDVVTTNEDTVLVFNAIIGTNGASGDNFAGVPELTAVTQGTKGDVTFEADGTITYSPLADLNGGDTFTYSVTSGGVIETGTVTVTINPINDAPTATNLTAAEIYLEDTPLDLVDIVITDPDSNVTARLTLSDPASGALSTATAGSVTSTFVPGTGVWQAVGDVADVNTLLAGVTFTPALDFNGDIAIAVNVTDGAAAVGDTKPVTGTPVNDVPAFTKGADITVLEDAAAQTISGWATAISKGAANETAQVVSFIVTANPTSLFATQPAVSANGSLSFLLAANTNGSSTVTVAVRDDGGTANGGIDTSATQTFTISTTAVNDAPSFVMGANIEVAQDAGPQNLPWATAINAGPGEGSQTVQFAVQADKPELFTVPPSITTAGRLIFTPAPGGSGIAVVTVTLQDNGGTADGGNDTSAARTFEIAVTSVAEELGSYFGLVQPAAGGQRENARTGTVQMKVGAGGAFTGKLNVAGQDVPMKGVIRNDGAARFGKLLTPTLAVLRKNQPQLNLILKIEVARGTNTFGGTLGGDTFAIVTGDRSLYTSKRAPAAPLENVPAALLGNYTVLLPALTPAEQGRAANSYPQGDGFGKLTVTTKGIGKLTGTLADGTKISSSAPIAKSGRWPVYRALGKTGSVIGFATFRNVANVSDVDASNLQWFHTAKVNATRYPNGWSNGIFVHLAGAKYTAPTRRAPGPVLPGLPAADADGNAELTLSDGGLGNATVVALSIDANNRPTVITTPGPKFKLAAKTGLLGGSFIHPTNGKKVSFGGAVLQKQQIGGGFFLGPLEGGAVVLVPDALPGVP